MHCRDRGADHRAALFRLNAGGARQRVGFGSVVGGVPHGRRHFLHGGRGFFQARGLLIRALREVHVAGGDFFGPDQHFLGGFFDPPDHRHGDFNERIDALDEGGQLARLACDRDPASQVALDGSRDDGLRLADCLAQLLREGELSGDVGSVFDDLERFVFRVQDRVVARLDPDLAAALGKILVLARVIFAPGELGPERPIGLAAGLHGVDEHAMVPAAQLLERVAHDGEEVGVGGPDRAVQIEFDHRLGLADGGELALAIGQAQHSFRHVDGVFDDFERLAAAVENGEVRGLDPHHLAVLGPSLILRRLGFTPAQLVPEQSVFRSIAHGLIDEHPVMLAAQFGARVARCLREILVAREDVAVQIELDDRQQPADGLDLATQIGPGPGIEPGPAQQRAECGERVPGHGGCGVVIKGPCRDPCTTFIVLIPEGLIRRDPNLGTRTAQCVTLREWSGSPRAHRGFSAAAAPMESTS